MGTIPRTAPRLSTWLLIVLVSRFIAGRDLDGQRRTNATFLRHADRDLTPHGRAGRWAHKRHAERALWRLTVTLSLLAALYGCVTAPHVTGLVLSIAACCGVTLGLWRGTVTVLRYRHMQRVVRPMYRAIAPLASLPPGDNPARYLTVPRNYRTSPDAKVRLLLNPAWQAKLGEQKEICAVVTRRLGYDTDGRFQQHAYPPSAEFVRAPEPPHKVTLAEFEPVIAALAENILALGTGTHNRTVSFDLDSETPHVALSMGTGGGKSDTIALIIAACVRKGVERIDVIDPKRVSHNWARGLPGVYIHRYVQGQMEAIHNARLLMDDRYNVLDSDPDRVFSRHVVIIEEQNSLIDDLALYWDEYRQGLTSKERGAVAKRNPAIGDLRYLLNKGRQCRINVISVFQRMSATAAGSGDMRENYGGKVLARCSPQTWKILTGMSPVPGAARSRIPGRAVFVLGDETHVVQRAYAAITKPDGSADREGIARLRAFALNGRPDIPAGPAACVPAAGPEPVADGTEPEYVSLREACETGVLSLAYSTARKARQRDREFPAGMTVPGYGGLYRPAELRAWEANRVRTRAA